MSMRIAALLGMMLGWGLIMDAGAQTAGLVDNYEGSYDPAFAGSYAAYGENNLGQDASKVCTNLYYSATHSRYLEQTATGGQSWGIVVVKTFSNIVDASDYSAGTLELWLYSAQSDTVRSIDVNLYFDQGGGNVSEYSLKTASEPTLAWAYNQWKKLSISLVSSSFDVEDAGDFDLEHLSQLKVLIRNNGAGSAARKIYFDDIRFVTPADTNPPSVSFIDPPSNGYVYATATPTFTGSLDDTGGSGIDVNNLTVTVDGAVSTNALVMASSFSFTCTNSLATGTSHTVQVTARDIAGNSNSATRTFYVDTSLPPPASLLNPSFEYGNGSIPANWGGFGVSSQTNVAPRTGTYHARLTGNYPGNGSANYSGFYQTLTATPGQTWKAKAYGRVQTALSAGCSAKVQLVYVDEAGDTLPGGEFNSAVTLSSGTSTGTNIEITAQGRAPVGTCGAKIVLLYIQSSDGNGVVFFDDASLTNITPESAVLPAGVLLDDFSDTVQYHSLNQNDLGQYTDDDATLSAESVADGVFSLSWTADSYWYSLLCGGTTSVSLRNNQYLSMRCRGVAGGEQFQIKLNEGGGVFAVVDNAAITNTAFHTYNYPLSDFVDAGLNLGTVKDFDLIFAGETPGSLVIDGIKFDAFRYPETISMTATQLVEIGEPFAVQITVKDGEGSVISDFDGSLSLAVSDGSVSPSVVTGFVDGSVSVQVTVQDVPAVITLTATDALGASGTAQLDVNTPPANPTYLLSSIGTNHVTLYWDSVPGADGYRVYRRTNDRLPGSNDLVATVGTTSYVDNAASLETPYFYRVAAYNESGNGEFTDVAIGTIYARDWAPAPETRAGLTHISRTESNRVILLTQGGQVPFIAGVDVGATVPGHSPGEMAIPREVYRQWFSQISGMGFRAIRVYTLHRPEFYEELLAYNTANPQAPLYLVHGAWLVEEERYITVKDLFDETVTQSFKDELEDIVGAVHGDLVRTNVLPGRATGIYTADVSPWLMSYIIGIEMDPEVTHLSDMVNSNMAAYAGTYFGSTAGATPTEIWYAEMFDHVATLEAARGRAMPISTSNYSTTDPLTHPDEPSDVEDIVGIDLNHLQSTTNWPCGHFANYHSYPYYPDIMRYEDGISNYVYKGYIDNYAGYIAKLKAHHEAAGIPLFISEFGVPSSIGNAHYGPLGRDQGNHSEQDQMAIDMELLDIIRNLKCSGGFVFMWMGEWFKTVWNVKDFHVPADRRWFWQNAWANEAHFGLVNGEPGLTAAAVVDGNDGEWTNNNSEILYDASGTTNALQEVRAIHDEGYLYLRIRTLSSGAWSGGNSLAVGFNVLQNGNQGLPGYPGLDTNADYALTFTSNTVGKAWVAAWNDYTTIKFGYVNEQFDVEPSDFVPGSGVWYVQTLLANRRVTVPTTQETYPAEIFPVGELHYGATDPDGETFDSRNTWMATGNVIEIRLPYSFIGYSDPSQRQAYQMATNGTLTLVDADTVGISVVVGGQLFQTEGYSWPEWNTVNWHPRLKADIDVLAGAVVDANHNYAPLIQSTPADTVTEDQSYSYTVDATDPNELELLTYSLAQCPSGMTIDAESGTIGWTPTSGDIGTHTVIVRVEDALGATDTQEYTLSVFSTSGDTDGDGMSDAWEHENGLDPFDASDAGEDPDADGLSNLKEYLWGGDPLEADNIDTEVKLTAADGTTNDYFGMSVDVDGHFMVVGAYGDDDKGSSSGSAYVFQRDGTNWIYSAKLTASDGAAADYFGRAVAISSNRIVVGAYGDDDKGSASGSAYVFEHSGTNWVQAAKLTASDGATSDYFGFAVSINGDRVAIGAYMDDDKGSASGSAYVFECSGTNWVQTAKLTASDGAVSDYFGRAVSISGDRVAIGAYLDDDKGTSSGSAYIFQVSGTNWTQVAKLTASDGVGSDYFGYSLDICGDRVVIGAYLDDDKGSNSGSAYIFQVSGTNWTQAAKLTATDGAAGDYFGLSVSLNADRIAVGACYDDDMGSSSGSAYLYTYTDSNWSLVDKMLPADGAAADYYGYSVSVSEHDMLVGAYQNDDAGSASGSAYVY